MLLGAELLGVAALAVILLVDLVALPPASLETAIALLVLALLLTVALGAALAGVWRGRGWARAAAVVYQVLQFAVGVGALQGIFAQPNWGWPLIIVSAAGFVMLISKPAAEWMRDRD